MPNFRAVGAGTIPPPPAAKEAFGIATSNSFDYSSFVFVGLTSLLAEGTEAHPRWATASTASRDTIGADSPTKRSVITW
jgi:hypothetical protein